MGAVEAVGFDHFYRFLWFYQLLLFQGAYPGDESRKLWSTENFENNPEPRSAPLAVIVFWWEGPILAGAVRLPRLCFFFNGKNLNAALRW